MTLRLFCLTPTSNTNQHRPSHCLKIVPFRRFSGLYFPVFYSINLHIQSECRKIQNRKTPHTYIFHAVSSIPISWSFTSIYMKRKILLWKVVDHCYWNTFKWNYRSNTEVYPGLPHTSKMESFVTIVNGNLETIIYGG